MKKKRKYIKLIILQPFIALAITVEKIHGIFCPIEPVRKSAVRNICEPEDEKELIRCVPKEKS